MTEPALREVRCLSPAGFHRMRYAEWGDPANPRVLVCGHGLTRTGRDFDRLARTLAPRMRVVCPDVVGRGASEWLRDPRYYQVPQYVADMVVLLAALGAQEVNWLGTSLGGLIGMSLGGMPGTPIVRLVLNDIGPRLEFAALQRIAAYVGAGPRFDSLEQAIAYNRSIAAGFAFRTEEDWREATVSVLRPEGAGFVLHYDPKIAVVMRMMTEEALQAGQAQAWELYDSIACPTLLLRGGNSDLLSASTAAEMCARGPRPRLVTFEGVGHAPMFFDEEQIEVVAEFLA